MLLCLRVAVLLAVLDRRCKVDDEDWALAGAVADVSDAVVAMGAAERARRAAEMARGETERAARHAVAADEAVDRSRLGRVATSVVRHVRSQPGITRNEVRRKLRFEDRSLIDEVVDALIADGLLREVIEPGQGADKRALYVPRSAHEAGVRQ